LNVNRVRAGSNGHDVCNEGMDPAHANMAGLIWMETYCRNWRGPHRLNSPYLNATYFDLTRGT
jgi:hypothetical protein